MNTAVAGLRRHAHRRAQVVVPIVAVALAVVLAVVYWPAWRIAPVADDFMIMIAAKVGVLRGAYAGEFMFRPLELWVLELSFALRDDPQLAKLVDFAGFLASLAILMWLARRIEPERPALPIVVGVLFGCHSISFMAITQIDTVSQQLATVFVLAGFAWYVFGPTERPWPYHLVGAGLVLLALLSKEVTVGAVFALPVAAAYVQLLGHGRRAAIVARRLALMLAYVTALFALYLALRSWAGAVLTGGDGLDRYVLGYGLLDIAKHVVLLVGSVAYLGSTLEIFLLDSPLRLVVSAALSVAFNGLALLGLIGAVGALWRGEADRRPLVLIGAAVLMLLASPFPVAFAGWPSELHAYLSAPFYLLVAAYFALSGWRSVAEAWGLRPQRAAALGLVALTLAGAWMLLGVREKLAFAEREGARSSAFLAQMTDWYEHAALPPGETATCLEMTPQEAAAPVYSVYAMEPYSLVQTIADWLNFTIEPRLHMPIVPLQRDACDAVVAVDGDTLELRASPR